jgi:phytoene/squalene synthetase
VESLEFYQAHLDRVSRSFAFCIQALASPLRGWVSLAYLMCRVLDTVEDSPWQNRALRDEVYAEFEGFLSARPAAAVVQAWSQKFPPTIPEGEKLLLKDAYPLFKDLHGLPAGAKLSLQSAIFKMYRGMRHYANTQDSAGSLKLKDLVDANRYCYFVAGVVGELLTGLVLEYRQEFRPGPEFMKNAFHFGLFLQKVNLLKDQRGDEKEGRFLVPNRQVMLASLRENARGAIDYITALPTDEKGYRTFCAWSLFLGAASLPFIEQAYQENDGSKIPRSATQEILSAIVEIAQNNEELRQTLDEYLPMLPPLSLVTGHHTSQSPSDGEWFANIADCILSPAEREELRL